MRHRVPNAQMCSGPGSKGTKEDIMSFCSTVEIHSNCVVLSEHCSGFVVAIRAAGVLSSASRSSG